jgi:hypothetical protein
LTKIQGLVIPTNWDSAGKVLDIAIASFNEDQFFVESNENAQGLFKCIGQAVVVRGFIKEVNNKKMITVDELISRTFD